MNCTYCGKPVDKATGLASDGQIFCNSLHRYMWRESSQKSHTAQPQNQGAATSPNQNKRSDLSKIGPALGAIVGSTLATLVLKDAEISFMVGAILGGIVSGTICGLLPFLLARKWDQRPFGRWSMGGCIFGGAMFGLYAAVPLSLILTGALWLVAKQSKTRVAT